MREGGTESRIVNGMFNQITQTGGVGVRISQASGQAKASVPCVGLNWPFSSDPFPSIDGEFLGFFALHPAMCYSR